jgi:hypothetical protein
VANNPQKQTQQAPEGVVFEVSSNQQPQAAEQVQHVPHTNGARAQQVFQAPAQVITDPAKILRVTGEGKKVIIDMSNEAGMLEFNARTAEAMGLDAHAAYLRGKQFDTSMSAGFSRTMERRIQVKDVVYVVAAGLALFLVYEGIAFKWDLPRAGIFDPANPLKALKMK